MRSPEDFPADIPPDIKAKAREALAKWHNGDDTSIHEMLEAVILAERLSATERAAKIAEKEAKHWEMSEGFEGETCLHIAAAIRSQP